MFKKIDYRWLIALTFVVVQTSLYAQSSLPSDAGQTLKTTYDKYRTLQDGQNAAYIPALSTVNPNYFAVAIASTDGKILALGDTKVFFPLESISKLFVYALAVEDRGEDFIAEKVGMDATGFPFNSVKAIEEKPDHLQNPLVNAGAIQVNSAILGKDSNDKWQRVLRFMQQLSNSKLQLGQTIYQSEMATNLHNQAIAQLLNSYNMLYSDPYDAVDRYTKACSVMVNILDLARMGAVIANGGKSPYTNQQLIPKKVARDILATMVTNGLYDKSGSWFFRVGVPTKSGVGGGMLAIIPGKMAIAVFSPPLDKTGSSVRGKAVIQDLVTQWELHILSF